MIKTLFKAFTVYVKKNFFACACFFWAIMIFLTGSFSYSKYISSDPVNKLPSAGSFSCSANIDGVSSLSFVNTAFWGGSIAEDKVTMNALRSIDFTVNNFQMVGDKKVVNEVKSSYSISFSAPYNFARRLAFQPFNFDEEGQELPILPQIVVEDIFHAAEVGADFNTAYSTDYDGITYHNELAFKVVKSGDDYTATSYDDQGNVVAQIKLEYFHKETHQKLLFRMWDVSELTSDQLLFLTEEGGKLLPPLEVYFRRNIPFYKIIISLPGQLVMPAAVETTKQHSVHLSPTHTIHDDHLGGYFVNIRSDGTYDRVRELYGENIENNWIIETVEEGHVGAFYLDEALTDPLLDGYGSQVVHVHDFNLLKEFVVYNAGDYMPGKPISYTEVNEHVHGDWTFADSKTEYIQLSNMTDVGVKKDSAGNWVLDTATYPEYKATISNAEKTIETSYSKMAWGAVTREVSEVEDIYVLSEKEGYDNPTNEQATLRVKYTDEVHTYVTGDVTKTTTTSYTFDLSLKQKSSNWWGSTSYNTVNNLNNIGFTKEVAAELLLGVNALTETETSTKTVTKDLGTATEIRYQKRVVTRTVAHAPVTIEYLRWPVFDENGNVTTDDEGNVIYRGYDHEDPLKLYGDDHIQDYFISPCYSKNFPFYVDVIFEQIQ